MDKDSTPIIFAGIALIISFGSLIIAQKNISNNLRSKIYDEQIFYIKELYSIIIEFSKYIDYGQPISTRKEFLDQNNKKEIMIDLCNKYYTLYYKSEIFLPQKIRHLFHDILFDMDNIIKSFEIHHPKPPFGDKVFEKIRILYFEKEIKLLKKIRKKFHIKKITTQNRSYIK